MRLAQRLVLALCLAHGAAHAHEGHEHAAPEPATAKISGAQQSMRATRLADGSVFVPKPAQFRLGLRSVPVAKTSAGDIVRLDAEIVPDPAASARIGSVERGLFEPASPDYLQLGAKVAKGTVLGYIHPLLKESDRIRRRAEIAQTEQELIINEQGLKQISLQLKGQPGMSSTTIYHDNIKNDRDRLLVKLREARASLVGRVALVAPLAGEISVARVRPGALVEAGETVFEVIQPERLWVEAQSYDKIERDAVVRAEARTRDGRTLPLKYVGQNLSASAESLALEFELHARSPMPRVGERVVLALEFGRAGEGAVLPQASLTRGSDGLSYAWVQLDAERYTRRAVTAEPLAGGRALIRAGLAPGERVVAEGGWLLDQVR